MNFTTDEYSEQLFLDGKEVPTEDGKVFDLLASSVAGLHLSGLPSGLQVRLCDRVIGSSNDFYPRGTDAIFENSAEHGLLVHLSTPFFVPSEDFPLDQRSRYFEESIQSGIQALNSLEQSGRLIRTETSVYDEIAYLSYTVQMHDQSFEDAEAFVTELDRHVADANTPPSLFLCHASEDKPFVDKLIRELDRYALYAWYDRREILVGDSIVEKINSGLGASDFLVAVLSPRSVAKRWVVREMSSTLMRQLNDRGIKILPILIETCEIPTLLADIKCADFTGAFEVGFRDLLNSIRRNS